MDLADFLLARIADDEEAVNSRTRYLAPGGWSYLEQFGDFGDDERWMIEIPAPRVVAECGAKRRIVAWHRLIDGLDTEDNPVRGCGNCIASGAEAPYLIPGPCLTVRLLALPYADHPDYQQEWMV